MFVKARTEKDVSMIVFPLVLQESALGVDFLHKRSFSITTYVIKLIVCVFQSGRKSPPLRAENLCAHQAPNACPRFRYGTDGYFGYPITPQSEVMETLMEERPWETTGMVILDDEQKGESASIQNQRDMLEHYVKARGWNIADVYVDDGYKIGRAHV